MFIPNDVRRIMRRLAPERIKYFFGLLSLFLVNLSDVLAPLFLAIAVDLVAAEVAGTTIKTPAVLELVGIDATSFTMWTAVGCYLGLALISNFFRYPMMMLIAVPSHLIGQSLRNTLVDHLLRLSSAFYDRARSGDLMSRMTADVNAMRMFYGPGIMVGMDTLFLVVLVLIVMFIMSWELTLVTMIPLPLIAIVTNKLSHAEYDRFAAVQKDLSTLTERARESYAGISIIQGYAREDHDRARFRAFSERHLNLNLRLAKIRALFDPTLDGMLGLSTTLVLIFGCFEVIDGDITLGTFVAFLFLVRHLSGPMIGFGWAVSLFQRGRASALRLQKLLDEPITIFDAEDAATPTGVGELEVKDLTFGYKDEDGETGEPVLHGINVKLPAGRSLGVIGPVGCGKTTLISLMARLYDPPPGTITLDGVNIRDLTLSSLREAVVVAPQDTFLFSDTVSRNIFLGGHDDLEAASARAVELAELKTEVDALPGGFGTILGPRGVNLSGGQRQRLAIARAIGADPKILVLDDCLSAVDSRTEEAILNNLDTVLSGRSGIVVSHRVAAVRRCDTIIVLEDGRITQRGTHEALLADQEGYYATIAVEQSKGEEQ